MARPLPISFFEVDIHWLKREGLLRPGAIGDITFSILDRVCGSVRTVAHDRTVEILADGGRQAVFISRTRVHFGWRAWFVCPSCDANVAKLYGGPSFKCRECRRISYPSQRESPRWRPLRRLQKIRRQLGGSENLTLPFPDRPKGMHSSTYFRQYERAIQIDRQHTSAMLDVLAGLNRRLAFQGAKGSSR